MGKNKSWKSLVGDLPPEGKLQSYHDREWIKARNAYESDPKDFFNAYHYLYEHPANRRWDSKTPGLRTSYSSFESNHDIMVVKVDPDTKRIEDNKKRNTLTNVWVEWGPWHELYEHEYSSLKFLNSPSYDGCSSHDPRVDTGGNTYEEAIVNLAHNVYMLYGNRERVNHDEKLKKKDRW